MADGIVQVPPDSSGKKVDTAELTRSDGVTVVERQRVIIGDPVDPTQFAAIQNGLLGVQADGIEQLLVKIHEELVDLKWMIIRKLG